MKVLTYQHSGTLVRERNLAVLPAIQMTPTHIDILAPDTIFHNIIMQSLDDVSEHISANDLLFTLKAQSKVLPELGLANQFVNPSFN